MHDYVLDLLFFQYRRQCKLQCLIKLHSGQKQNKLSTTTIAMLLLGRKNVTKLFALCAGSAGIY